MKNRNKQINISIIGAGRVATQLAEQLFISGYSLREIVNRSIEKAELLAQKVNATAIDSPAQLSTENLHILLIAIADDAIAEVAQQLPDSLENCTVAHTSGSVSTTVLSRFRQFGSFYPLQSFSPEKKVNWQKLPLLLDGNKEKSLNALQRLASGVGNQNTHLISDQQRENLHLAAVFANNFVNHLWNISEQLLQEKGISFDLLRPLIHETTQKALHNSPQKMQTGPAIRGDQKTMHRHSAQLEKEKRWQEIYRLLSEDIADAHIQNKG